jgi:hypothetical protein
MYAVKEQLLYENTFFKLYYFVWGSFFVCVCACAHLEMKSKADSLCFHPFEQLFSPPSDPICSVIMKNLSMLSFVCRCCQCNQSGAETAQLLSKLDYEEIVSILSCKEFNSLNLKDCLKLGIQLTLQVT